ncbi:TraC family protein [uncultured Roseobacter sp.]|uniref:TraC family protein n=1 Tax=uncultured Roseobacter sp. TaxID=114847 RepID=UPI00260F7C15|nr:TraC family protein [uncultured Roseobacter sp.]
MARKSIATLKAEMAALEAQISEAEERAAIKIGKLAAAEGLLDLSISDAEWKTLFKEFAGRFQKRASNKAQEGPVGHTSGQAA